MLSLDEAIKHCEEVAEKNEGMCRVEDAMGLGLLNAEMMKCASEHRQLAEWLRELKQRRNNENGCQYCKYKVRSDEDEPCVICSHNYTSKFKDDGTREVKADDDK